MNSGLRTNHNSVAEDSVSAEANGEPRWLCSGPAAPPDHGRDFEHASFRFDCRMGRLRLDIPHAPVALSANGRLLKPPRFLLYPGMVEKSGISGLYRSQIGNILGVKDHIVMFFGT